MVAVDPPAKSLTFGGFSGKPLDFNQKVQVSRSNPIAVKLKSGGCRAAEGLEIWRLGVVPNLRG